MGEPQLSQSLANKYRSQTFDELVGQDILKVVLKQQIISPNGHSNYLFYGPRGTGKTSTARIFARALNCLSLNNGNPCNTCLNCTSILQNTAIDMVEIDAASHTGVDNIREEVIEKAGYSPIQLKKKVYIIDEVHMLSKNAFNALLKLIEEPPEYLVFILATTELQKVPETIVSRCQVFGFKKIPDYLIVEHLQYIAQAESLKVESEVFPLIAELSEGCLRDANKFLDQLRVFDLVTLDQAQQVLGAVSTSFIKQLVDALCENHFIQAITVCEDILNTGTQLTTLAKSMIRYLDKVFLQNPGKYLPLIDFAKELLMQAKWFPDGLILCKVQIWLFCERQNLSFPTPSVVKGNSVTPQVPEVPVIVPFLSDSVIVSEDDSIGLQDLTKIYTSIISQIKSVTFQSIMKESSALLRVDQDAGIAYFAITGSMAKQSFSKKEYKSELEELLSVFFKKPFHYQIQEMTKEEFALSQIY